MLTQPGELTFHRSGHLSLADHVDKLADHEIDVSQLLGHRSLVDAPATQVLDGGDQLGAFFHGLVELGLRTPLAQGRGVNLTILHQWLHERFPFDKLDDAANNFLPQPQKTVPAA